jgi:hypothetical protein
MPTRHPSLTIPASLRIAATTLRLDSQRDTTDLATDPAIRQGARGVAAGDEDRALQTARSRARQRHRHRSARDVGTGLWGSWQWITAFNTSAGRSRAAVRVEPGSDE